MIEIKSIVRRTLSVSFWILMVDAVDELINRMRKALKAVPSSSAIFWNLKGFCTFSPLCCDPCVRAGSPASETDRHGAA
jgi:hypothetical protein